MKISSYASCISLTLFISGTGLVEADQFDILNTRFSGDSQPLRSATFGNGVYIAVGDNGTILSSADTITWIPQMSGTTNKLNGVRYGDSGFVAVGESAPGMPSTILNSSNGIAWTQRTSPVTNRLSAICYGFGRYVAVGSKGTVVTSTNAINWTHSITGAPFDLNGVDTATVFVAVGDSGTILTSPDGLAWTARFSGIFARLTAISALVAVGESGTVATSSEDSVSWTLRTSGTANDFFAIATSQTGMRAVGAQGAFISSLDGVSWTPQQSNTSNDLHSVIYANGNFLAVGNSGAIQAGTAWIPRNSGTTQPLACVTYGSGEFVSVGGNMILSSSNGADWVTQYSGNNGGLSGVTPGSDGFVAVGAAGLVLSSSNATIWIDHSINATNNLLSVAYGNGVYVAVGVFYVNQYPFGYNAPAAFRSTNGGNWTGPFLLPDFYAGYPSPRVSVTFGTNSFVAVGRLGSIATSPNGETWTSRNSGVSYDLNAVAFGNGAFVAVGQVVGGSGTQITISLDGTNWTAHSSGSCYDYSIVYGDEGFVSPGYTFPVTVNVISTSPDGVTWAPRRMEGDIDGPQTRSITFGNGMYVAVGDAGIIYQSTPVHARASPLLGGFFSNRGFELSAIAEPGYNFSIQSCTNLSSSNWTDIFEFASTQVVTGFLDSTATNQLLGFYRIVPR